MLKESNARKGFFEHGDFLALRHGKQHVRKLVLANSYFTILEELP